MEEWIQQNPSGEESSSIDTVMSFKMGLCAEESV